MPATPNDVQESARRVLLVEDDEAISDIVRSTLSGEGYDCVAAYSGTEARLLIDKDMAFDLVICDLMLPGMPGEDIVRLVRRKGDAPVLVTSARSAVVDRVALLRMGADDYLVKPFDLDELVARVGALLRRSRSQGMGHAREEPHDPCGSGSSVPLEFRLWRLFEDERRLEVAGRPVRLTRTEFGLVLTLMRHPRKVFTKRELYRTIWNEDAPAGEKSISTHISNIRAKLRGTGTDGYLQTVWGIGFKLIDETDARTDN